MPAWPPSLPQNPQFGWSESPEPNVVRSTTESGQAKTRRRNTKTNWTLVYPVVFTETEVDTFWTFFEVTLGNGALRFDHVHPRTSALESFRFKKPPTFVETENCVYRANLELDF